MKHRTAELEGALLDAAVAMAEGIKISRCDEYLLVKEEPMLGALYPPFTYSRSWEWGGPIIERERIDIGFVADENHPRGPNDWWAEVCAGGGRRITTPTASNGPTPLIAAMRAYVALKLGDEVELP